MERVSYILPCAHYCDQRRSDHGPIRPRFFSKWPLAWRERTDERKVFTLYNITGAPVGISPPTTTPNSMLRERGGALKWDRDWIATILTAQVAAGAALRIAAQVFLVWVIIGYLMPCFGLEFLDMARDVAAFNLPAPVGELFWVSL